MRARTRSIRSAWPFRETGTHFDGRSSSFSISFSPSASHSHSVIPPVECAGEDGKDESRREDAINAFAECLAAGEAADLDAISRKHHLQASAPMDQPTATADARRAPPRLLAVTEEHSRAKSNVHRSLGCRSTTDFERLMQRGLAKTLSIPSWSSCARVGRYDCCAGVSHKGGCSANVICKCLMLASSSAHILLTCRCPCGLQVKASAEGI
eukprot:scaffold60205_cov31-Tisochrysis_lutea.AAC.2